MGRLLTTFKDKTFEPSMKSYFKLYTDDTTTASQIYDSLLYVRGTNAGSLVKNQENDDDVSTVETYDTYMPVRFHNIKSASDGATPAGPTHTFYSVYNRAEYNGPSGQNMYDLYADYNIAKLSGDGYITNSIGGAYNYGYDAGSGDGQTIPGVYGVVNYARVQPTGSNRTVSYNIGARNWVDINKSDLTATYVYPTISEFAHRTGTVGTLAMHKFDLDYTEGNVTNAYFIWADESTLPTPSGEKYFIKSNIPWPTLLSGALTNTGAVTFNSTLSVSGTATLSSNVNIGGNLVVTGTSTFNGGTITIGDAASDNVVFGADVDSHIIPDDDNTYDLGSSTQEWRNLYVDGTAYVDAISMGGDINLGDNQYIYLGDSNDLQLYHDGTHSYVQNTQNEGDLVIQNGGNDKDISFRCDDGSGGLTEYFRIDGQYELNRFVKNARFIDGVKANFGTTDDLQIYHSSGSNIIDATVGDLIVKVSQDDGDIIFQSDDGSGAISTYFRVDGGTVKTIFEKEARFNDSTKLFIGSSNDLEIFHDSSNTYLENYTGNFIFTQALDDGDMIFKCDNGSGGTTEYFKLDGTNVRTLVSKNFNLIDDVILQIGNSQDLRLYHNGSHSYISQAGVGNLYIQNEVDDGDIKFLSDDGSGGTAEYFRLDGSETLNRFYKNVKLDDSVQLQIGSGADCQIVHNGTDTQINNTTGHLQFTQLANDKDISFASDDGSGGDTIYMTIDGGQEKTTFSKNTEHQDNVKGQFGNSGDFNIFHDGTDSKIENDTGDLYIRNNSDDKDIYFQTDDGSGNTTTYFHCDGSSAGSGFTVTLWPDNNQIGLGTGKDLRIYHQSSDNTSRIQNLTNDLIIVNDADDGDIILKTDNGSGGNTAYITLDGGDVSTKIETIKVLMPNLPTSNPSVAGQLWNDSGTLKISAG